METIGFTDIHPNGSRCMQARRTSNQATYSYEKTILVAEFSSADNGRNFGFMHESFTNYSML